MKVMAVLRFWAMRRFTMMLGSLLLRREAFNINHRRIGPSKLMIQAHAFF